MRIGGIESKFFCSIPIYPNIIPIHPNGIPVPSAKLGLFLKKLRRSDLIQGRQRQGASEHIVHAGAVNETLIGRWTTVAVATPNTKLICRPTANVVTTPRSPLEPYSESGLGCFGFGLKTLENVKCMGLSVCPKIVYPKIPWFIIMSPIKSCWIIHDDFPILGHTQI